MNNALGSSVRFFQRVWRLLRWPIAVLALLYAALVVYELVTLPKRTEQAVAAIHAQKLTMDDVDGKHLPPVPNPKLVDATVEGIDANKNGIRDDVEHLIFKRNPVDVRMRSAEMQYVMALQLYLTAVSNSDTLIEVIHRNELSGECLASELARVVDANRGLGWSDLYRITQGRGEDLKSIVLNNSARKTKYEEVFGKYLKTYGETRGVACDLNADDLQ